MATTAQIAVLAELGIVPWQARAGQVFPGAGEVAVAEALQAPKEREPVVAVEPMLDLCLYANTASEAEVELLARILHAVQGLRGDLRIEQHTLDAPRPPAHAHLRLDDVDLPSPTAMLADASSKRRVWQALQDAVARLP